MLLSHAEAYQLFTLTKKTEKIEGEIAEVGTYRGGSARIILEARGGVVRPVHLFDTFEGLPAISDKDDGSQYHKGQLSSSFDEVKRLLAQFPNVYVYKGIFPDTADPISYKKFSLVHLDVDIYESTMNCLKFFYPRMSSGGIIISHNYSDAVGVRRAFDEFFKDKLEIVIELLAGGQCLIVKI